MMRWLAASMAVLSLVFTGCADESVKLNEIGQLEELRDVHVALTPGVFSVGQGARIGVAGDGRERVDFAVVIGDVTPRRVTIRSTSYVLISGCAGAGFYATTDLYSTVANSVESAVYDKLAPDAYCEG